MKNILKVSTLFLFFLILNNCKKEESKLPSVLTNQITQVSYRSADCGGEVLNEGENKIISRGVCWNISPKPTISNFKTIESGGLGKFISKITNLIPNTKYYVRAYASNSEGISYGEEISFTTTQVNVPVLSTKIISSITLNSAISGGIIVSDNGDSIFERGVCWSSQPTPTILNNKYIDGKGIGEFNCLITGLLRNSIYYIRSFASNNAGTGYGEELIFKTSNIILFDRTFQKLNEYSTTGGFSVTYTSDGGYVTACSGTYGDAYDLMILKLDSFGELQWNKVIKFHNEAAISGIITQTLDGGYIVSNRAKIVKLDESGNLLWKYPQVDSGFYYCSVIETLDDNYLVAGWRLMPKLKIIQASLTKFSNEGKVLWEKFYGTKARTEGNYLCQTDDGNIVLLGTSGMSDDELDVFVFKLDQYGNLIWEKGYFGLGADIPQQIKLTSDGGFIISGYGRGVRDVCDARILKINAVGDLQWEKTFLWDYFKTYAFSIDQTKDGGYIFTGGNGYTPEECILVKLNSTGNLLWKKSIKPDYMDYNWYGLDVKQTKDLGYIISGRKGWVWTDEWNGNKKESGLWLLKTDENGNYKY
jgi:hypothetical protein